jgi:putative membrane protein
MTKLAILVFGAGVLVPGWASAQAVSDSERYVWGHPIMEWGWGWGGMIFGPVFMILVLALVIAVAVQLVRSIGGPWPGAAPHQQPSARTPLDILRERLAKGEIDKQEFEERRRILGE